MQALERLGLKLKEQIGLEELLSENFNPQLYGLTSDQEEKVSALRDIVTTYTTTKEDITGKTIRRSEDAGLRSCSSRSEAGHHVQPENQQAVPEDPRDR